MKKSYPTFIKVSIFLCVVFFTQNVFAQSFTFPSIAAQTYGAANFAPGATASSGAITYTSSNTAVATIVSGNIHITGAGTSTITATNGTNMLKQTLTVNKAPLTITANNVIAIQGTTLPVLTVSYSGFVNGDTQTEFTAQPTVSTTATSSSAMGYYPITVSGGSSADYTFTYIQGRLTMVTVAYLEAATSSTYGAAPFYTFGVATSGITYSSSNTKVATVVSTTGLLTITGAGTTTITFGSGTGKLTKTLTVNKAPLTITANNVTAIQGTSLPTLTVSYSGFVNGDTQTEFTTQPTVSTAATSSSAMGTYPIAVSGGSSADYTFTYAQGKLTMVTVGYLETAISSTYGAAPFYTFGEATSGITYSSSNAGVATVASTTGLLTITGAGTTTITFGSGTGKLTKTLIITKAPLTITANNQTKVSGTANPTLTASYSGFVNGDTQKSLTTQPTITTTATATSSAGIYPITASGAVDANYTITYVAGTLTITSLLPVISYTTPQTYKEGTAITSLAPKSTGGTVPLFIYGKTTLLVNTNNNLNGAATDPQGNIYVANGTSNIIQKITPAGVVTTFAGSGKAGSANGTGTAASFNSPSGLASDASGNIYVGDGGNGLVRKITPAGVVTTLAASYGSFGFPAAVAVDQAGNVYTTDGNASIYKITPGGVVTTIATGFNSPFGLAVNSSGSIIYVSDDSNRVFTVTQSGTVTVLAGSGAVGAGNGTGTAATFNNPNNLSVDALGNLYVNDSSNNLLRVVSPAGVVTTLAGSGVAGDASGRGTAATLNFPFGSAIDPTGNYLYVANSGGAIQKIGITGYSISPALPPGLAIDSTGTIKGTPTYASNSTNYTISAHNAYGTGTAALNITVTGSNYQELPPAIVYAGPQYYTEGTAIPPLTPTNNGGAVPLYIYGKTTLLVNTNNNLNGAATDPQGNIYVANGTSNIIQKITPAGVVTTFAGSGKAGSANGTGTSASFNSPSGLASDASGNIYVGDGGNGLVRKITPAGVVTTLAASYGSFGFPAAVAVDQAGNVYVADGNASIDKITPAGVVTTIATGFNSPFGVAINSSGSIIYVSDDSNRVFTVTQSGMVTVLAGSGAVGAGNGTGTAATFNNPNNLSVDALGNVYLNDSGNNLLKVISPAGVVTTLAGSGVAGDANGTGTAATLNFPFGSAIDPTGNYLYVANSGGAVQKIGITGYSISPALPPGLAIDSTGTIKGTPTYASNSTNYTISAHNAYGAGTAVLNITVSGSNYQQLPPAIVYSGPQTYAEGTAIPTLAPTNNGGSVPLFFYGRTILLANTNNNLNGAAVDPEGNIYVANGTTNIIQKITQGGVISTFAGSGTAGSANGTGTAASFNGPAGLASDASGNIYVGDTNNGLIRKITPAGVVTTVAPGYGSFGFPAAVAVDQAGNVYTTDGNTAIYKITQAGVVTTIASGFNSPFGIAVNSSGSIIYVSDFSNRVFTVTQSGTITVLAGSGAVGAGNGTGIAATFNNPNNLSVDALGNLYVNDSSNNLIRVVSPAGVVTTLAGSGVAGDANGLGTAATLNFPYGSAIGPNGDFLYVANSGGAVQRIAIMGYSISPALPQGMEIDSAGNIKGTPVYASKGTNYTISAHNPYGAATAALNITVTGSNYQLLPPQIRYPEGEETYTAGTAIATLTPINTGGAVPDSTYNKVSTFAINFSNPSAEVADAAGNIYVADQTKNVIHKITHAGVVTTFAGSGTAGSVNATGTAASFNGPDGLAIDAAGNIYVSDYNNNLIRKITPAGVVSTFAGSGSAGSINGSSGTSSFNKPVGLAADASGNIYVADAGNNKIRKITPAGMVSTYAGTGTASLVNGADSIATFHNPVAVTIDASGNTYVCDNGNQAIRRISSGLVSTFSTGYNMGPAGITVDLSGNVYVAHTLAHEIIKIVPASNNVDTYTPTAFVLAGATTNTTSQNGIGTAAGFSYPSSVAFDNLGNLYVGDGPQVRRISLVGYALNTIVTDSSGYTNTSFAADEPLPPGLSFNPINGAISGTPTTASSTATDYSYFITAYNAAGSSTTTISFDINAAPATDKAVILPFLSENNEPVVSSALSPNGDGINDVLTITNIEKYPDNKLIVVNANGSKVFEMSHYDNVSRNFNGHSSVTGQMQRPGTYLYELQYNDGGSIKTKTGYIVLKY